MVDGKLLSEGMKRFFLYRQGTSIEIGIDWYQLWGKKNARGGWVGGGGVCVRGGGGGGGFHRIGRQYICMTHMYYIALIYTFDK